MSSKEDENLYMAPEYRSWRPYAHVASALLVVLAFVMLGLGLLGLLPLFTLWTALLVVLAVTIWFLADRPIRPVER